MYHSIVVFLLKPNSKHKSMSTLLHIDFILLFFFKIKIFYSYDFFQEWSRNQDLDGELKAYLRKVLVSEALLKIYRDFFNFSKVEAVTRLHDTPVHDTKICRNLDYIW